VLASPWLEALLRAFLLLSGYSDTALADEEMPASGPDPAYNAVAANHLRTAFKNLGLYEGFEISPFRWVHSFKGWASITCVRFQDHGYLRTYAVFIKDGHVIDSRYAVQIDACNTQTYPGVLGARPDRHRGRAFVAR
jgi:hypothetical protein